MIWLKEHWYKAALVLLASVVTFGVINYLNEKNKIAQEIASREEIKYQERSFQEKREYTAKRKKECYDIYVKERAKWNNAESPEYDEEDDVCRIRFKVTDGSLKGVDCNTRRPAPNDPEVLRKLHLRFYFDCITKTFTTEY